MGSIGFTPLQKKVFEAFSKHETASQFYFTGGTALSVFYLHHRESDDLDFFSEQDFPNDGLIAFVDSYTKKNNLRYRFQQKYKSRIFTLLDNDKMVLKVDFVHYPYALIKKGKKVDNIAIDSIRDITANKLLTILQRTEVKDYVDFYFLLKKFTIWDAIYAAEAKFNIKVEPFLLATDLLSVESFDYLPKMYKKLKLDDLHRFYKKLAQRLARRKSE